MKIPLTFSLLTGLLITQILVLSGCAKETPDALVAEPLRAIKYTVLGEDTQSALTRELSGQVKARNSSELSFQVGGQVTAVNVEVGESVSSATVIAQIDPKPYELRLRTLAAQLASAESALRERQQNFLKQEKVFTLNYISRSDLDIARAQYEQAQSAVELANSRIALAQRDLRQTALVAPFNGVINRIAIEPFEDVEAGAPVFEIQGDAGLEVALLLPGRLLGSVERGSSARVAVPALGIEGRVGTVTELGLRAEGAGAYPLTVSFQNDATAGGERIKAGMTARVTLPLAGDTLLTMPSTAVLAGASQQQFAFRYSPQSGLVQRVSIATSPHSLTTVAVSSGLSAGDIVATAGVEFLRDGQTVTLYEPPR